MALVTSYLTNCATGFKEPNTFFHLIWYGRLCWQQETMTQYPASERIVSREGWNVAFPKQGWECTERNEMMHSSSAACQAQR